MLLVPEQPVERGIARHLTDPECERNVLTAQAVRLALPVPSLRDVVEKAPHRWWHSEPVAQDLADLAHRDNMGTVPADRARKAADAAKNPAREGTLRSTEAAGDTQHQLRRAAEHHRREVLQQSTLVEEPGSDLCVGGATQVDEQTAVVGLARGL